MESERSIGCEQCYYIIKDSKLNIGHLKDLWCSPIGSPLFNTSQHTSGKFNVNLPDLAQTCAILRSWLHKRKCCATSTCQQVRSTFGKSKSLLRPLTCRTCSRAPDICKYSKCARCSKITQGCSRFKFINAWNHNILACYWYIVYLGKARRKCSCIQELNRVWMRDGKKL